MARINPRERAQRQRTLMPLRSKCPACGGFMRIRYGNHRTLVMLDGAVRLTLSATRVAVRRTSSGMWYEDGKAHSCLVTVDHHRRMTP